MILYLAGSWARFLPRMLTMSALMLSVWIEFVCQTGVVYTEIHYHAQYTAIHAITADYEPSTDDDDQ